MSDFKNSENFIGDSGVVVKKDIVGNIVTVYSLFMFFILAFLGFMAILY